MPVRQGKVSAVVVAHQSVFGSGGNLLAACRRGADLYIMSTSEYVHNARTIWMKHFGYKSHSWRLVWILFGK